jgi:intraflagellar transport protein 122
LSWSPSKDDPFDVLAVGCWDQTLSFYQLNGIQHNKDKKLGFDPCTVSYFSNGEYIVIGGSDRKVTLWTKEGVKLAHVANTADWVLSAKPRPNQNQIAVGDNSGTVSVFKLQFSVVHGM